MFADRGFGATTVREIADAAGILSGSLYHHFDSKESIVDELVHAPRSPPRGVPPGRGHRRRPASRCCARSCAIAFTAVHTDRATVAVMRQGVRHLFVSSHASPTCATSRRRRNACGAASSSAACESGVFRAGLESRMLYRFIRDAIWNSVRWYDRTVPTVRTSSPTPTSASCSTASGADHERRPGRSSSCSTGSTGPTSSPRRLRRSSCRRRGVSGRVASTSRRGRAGSSRRSRSFPPASRFRCTPTITTR